MRTLYYSYYNYIDVILLSKDGPPLDVSLLATVAGLKDG